MLLLTEALLKSVPGAAFRRKVVRIGKGTREEFHLAFIGQDRAVYMFNGRNGTIRRMSQEDQVRDDWNPVMKRSPVTKKFRKQLLKRRTKELAGSASAGSERGGAAES